MVVTKHRLLSKHLLFILLSVLLVQGIACTVANESDTPNSAFSCNPTDAQISDFVTNVYDTDIQSCVSCHSGQGNALNGPPIFADPDDTADKQKANFCSTYFRAQLSSTVLIINYPQTDKHGPTGNEVKFSSSDLSNLINFFNNVTLE